MLKTLEVERQGVVEPHGDVRGAEAVWSAVLRDHGFKGDPSTTIIKGKESQRKVSLNEEETVTLTVNAGSASGFCVNDKSCHMVCVVEKGGNALYPAVQRARQARGEFLYRDPAAFATVLHRDLQRFTARGVRYIRPNTNSDVAWERVFPWMFDMVRGYDYTKRVDRVGWMHDNYRVTYSATSATRDAQVQRIVDNGDTVTMVFPIKKGQPMIAERRGVPVIDGDVTDFRYGDPSGVIVGLRAKAGLVGKTEHPLLSTVA